MHKKYYSGVWWKFVYIAWPPFLRFYEMMGLHEGRQNFHVGYLRKTKEQLRQHLLTRGYEHDYIALIDTNEIFGLRKVITKELQYHIRLYSDKEIRAHYEYTPEAHPIDHTMEKLFLSKKSYFRKLLKKMI